MKPEELAQYIQKIPLILEYYVPGFLTIYLYRFFKDNDKDRLSDSNHFGACICISSILRIPVVFVFPPINSYVQSILISVVGCILAYLAYRSKDWTWIARLFSRYTESSSQDSVLNGCNFYKQARIVKVITERYIVEGRVQLYNQSKYDNWIVLDEIICTDIISNKKETWLERGKKYERYIIPFDDIKLIIAVYDKEKDPEMVSDHYDRQASVQRSIHSNRKNGIRYRNLMLYIKMLAFIHRKPPKQEHRIIK